MSSFTALDLEAGPSGTGSNGARPTSTNPSSQHGDSVETRAMTACRPQPRGPKVQPQTHERPEDETMFVGDAGQSLLLTFESNKDKGASAILIPVF